MITLLQSDRSSRWQEIVNPAHLLSILILLLSTSTLISPIIVATPQGQIQTQLPEPPETPPVQGRKVVGGAS